MKNQYSTASTEQSPFMSKELMIQDKQPETIFEVDENSAENTLQSNISKMSHKNSNQSISLDSEIE